MLDVAFLVIPLFTVILLGYVAGRLVSQPVEGLAWLNVFVVYVALPALFVRLLSRTPVEQFGNLRFIAATTFATLTTFTLCFVLGGLRNRGNVAESTIQGFAGAYGNIGYMGPPLALAAFGPEAAVPVALVFCFDNALHFTLAPLLMALHKGGAQRVPALLGQIAVKILTHPFILATMFGIAAAVSGVSPPAWVDRLLEILANGAAPCALFAMGVTAALRPLKRIPPELAYLVPIKLLLAPVVCFLLLRWIAPDVTPVWMETAVLMAALPAATNVFVIAQSYSVWEQRASSVVVISTVCAVVTVTVLLYLGRSGRLEAWFTA